MHNNACTSLFFFFFFFLTNGFLTPKSVIQEYLSPFRSSKVQNVSVLLRGGGGSEGKSRGRLPFVAIQFQTGLKSFLVKNTKQG